MAADPLDHNLLGTLVSFAHAISPLALATALIAITFIVHLAILWAGTRRVKHAAKQICAGVRPAGSSTMGNAFDDFQGHLVVYTGKQCRTTTAEFFFQDTAMVSSFLPLRHLAGISNFMLTIGIFCTFLSLAVGLAGNTTIDRLTPYVGGALLSSLIGLLFSLLFSFLHSVHLEQARGAIRSLVCRLDAGYALVTAEQLYAAGLLHLENVSSSLDRYRESHALQVLPKLEAMATASKNLHATLSGALAKESERIGQVLGARLAEFEAGWKGSVEATLHLWSSTFISQLDSAIVPQVEKIMDKYRAVLELLVALERRIAVLPGSAEKAVFASLSRITTGFDGGANAISSGVKRLVEEFQRGTGLVVQGFAGDLSAAHAKFTHAADTWLTDASDSFSATLSAALSTTATQSADEMRKLIASLDKAAGGVEARFAGITEAYEAFNRQHARFRTEIKEASITVHEWHEDAVRTEVKLLHDWSLKLGEDLLRMGDELNRLVTRAAKEVLGEIEGARRSRTAADAILAEAVRNIRTGRSRDHSP